MGVPAEDQVDQAEHGQADDRRGDDRGDEPAAAQGPGQRQDGGGRPGGEDDRGPDVGPEPPGREQRAEDDRRAGEGGDRDAPCWRLGSPGGNRLERGPHTYRDGNGQRCLELVADPVEADPQAGVGAQQRADRERGAQQDVDGVDADEQPADAASARQSLNTAKPSPASSGAPTATTCRSVVLLGSTAAVTSSSTGRQIADSPRTDRAGRARRPRLRRHTSAAIAAQSSRLLPITRSRRGATTRMRSIRSSIADGSTSPSERIGSPLISSGTGTSRRSRIVGAMSVVSTNPSNAGGVGGEVAVEPLAGDPKRKLAPPRRGRALHRDQQVVSAQSRDQGRKLVEAGPEHGEPGEAITGFQASLDAGDHSVAVRHDQRRAEQILVGCRRQLGVMQGGCEQPRNDLRWSGVRALEHLIPVRRHGAPRG